MRSHVLVTRDRDFERVRDLIEVEILKWASLYAINVVARDLFQEDR
ncbi:hypothetical protein [Sulfuracidifex tepidarius]|nr:hypothetical protein [Sulfuracidifex tepidarius]